MKSKQSHAQEIASLIDQLQYSFPSYCYTLFGSRARGTDKKYSDFDIGIYCKDKIDFAAYSKLLNLVGDWNENELSTVQLVNLNEADPDFLNEIRKDLIFLSGNYGSWIKLNEKQD